MHPTGFVRKLDPLGRITLPKGIRTEREIISGIDVEIDVDKDSILITRYIPKCYICGKRSEDVVEFKGKNICRDCIDGLKEI